MIPVVAASNPVRHPGTSRRFSAVPVKAETIALAPNATVEEAFRSVARSALAQITGNAGGAVDSRDAEFVHQMRVGTRRFRSALVAFRAAIPPAASAAIRAGMRATSDALGEARDWDVWSRRVAAARATRFPERASLELLIRHVAVRRAAAVRRMRRVVAAGETRQALRRARDWLARASWRGDAPPPALAAPIAPLARRSLKRRLLKVLKYGRSAAALGGDDRHALRIRIKRLRYVCEFFSSLFRRKPTKAFIRRLQHLQDTLGELNDIAVAQRLLGEDSAYPPGARLAVARMRDRLVSGERRLLDDLDPAWKKLKAADPFW